jgi:sugar-phosphatase
VVRADLTVRAVVVAGAAGTGKSTLGEALARRTGAVLLDLDSLTNTLLDTLFVGTGQPGHWNDDRNRPVVRPARYAALLDVAATQVRLGHDVVLVAPFSAELRGGPEWRDLDRALGHAQVLVVWLHASTDVLQRRVAGRAAARDGARTSPATPTAPYVPHLPLDATLPTDEQVRAVLDRRGNDPAD